MGENEILCVDGSVYRHVLLVASRREMPLEASIYDVKHDLVLTYDFGLFRQIQRFGGRVGYVDRLCAPEVMQENNYRIYRFFANWHLDVNGEDLFQHSGIGFGLTFRIDIWNDFTFYLRTRLCLERLRGSSYKRLLVGDNLVLVESVLQDMDLSYERFSPSPACERVTAYYFPIHRWIDERLRPSIWRVVLRDAVIATMHIIVGIYDNCRYCFAPPARVFVQEYHSTRSLLYALQRLRGIQVLQGHFSARPGLMKFFCERPIPVLGSERGLRQSTRRVLDEFRARRCSRLVLTGDIDVTEAVYAVIERRIVPLLAERVRALAAVIRYLDTHPLNLVILIANIGQIAMLVDCVAKARNIPVYLIINGLLGNDFLDEGKFATVINAYGPSIRDHYFRGMENVLCIGDPRMDAYAMLPRRALNRTHPTITIGTSGFNNVDLNSFLAVEFVFMAQVLEALTQLRSEGVAFNLVLKVRPNGYSHLYRDFCVEYFSILRPRILDQTPMCQVLMQTDFYISIYSQTLFEASTLGIPCIYHKVDSEMLDPPFDGRSELVTTTDVGELVKAIRDFFAGSERFDAFLDREVMARYIGPLDGQNLARNLSVVRELLSTPLSN